MRTITVIMASAFNLLAFGIACAHGDHPSTHGGTVGRGNDEIVVEFVMENGTLTLYLDDEDGKPLATENVTGTLTLTSPQRPAKQVTLVQAGPHKFTAPGIEPVRGDRLRARFKLPSGEEVQSLALFIE